MTKSEVIERAVKKGLGTPEELGELSTRDIQAIIKQSKQVETEADTAEIEFSETPVCDHEFTRVRRVADKGQNYKCDYCYKCGAEKNREEG